MDNNETLMMVGSHRQIAQIKQLIAMVAKDREIGECPLLVRGGTISTLEREVKGLVSDMVRSRK